MFIPLECWLTSCPCGEPVSQIQLPASEPLTQILHHIQETFPNTREEETSWADRAPDCMLCDKSCKALVLRLKKGHSPYWSLMAFLVDLFHLENHDHKDLLCQIYCNTRSDENRWFIKETYQRISPYMTLPSI